MAIISTVVILWDAPHEEYQVINEDWKINDESLPPTLSPGYECLVPYIPFAIPDYDQRLYKLKTIKQPTETPHPVYTTQNQWLITYEAERRTDAEIIFQIEAAENVANEQLFPLSNYKKLNIIALNAVRKYVQGGNVNQFETDLFTKIAQFANAFYDNLSTSDNYKTIVAGGGSPNLSEGYINEIT
jgi:hypothetical protein